MIDRRLEIVDERSVCNVHERQPNKAVGLHEVSTKFSTECLERLHAGHASARSRRFSDKPKVNAPYFLGKDKSLYDEVTHIMNGSIRDF